MTPIPVKTSRFPLLLGLWIALGPVLTAQEPVPEPVPVDEQVVEEEPVAEEEPVEEPAPVTIPRALPRPGTRPAIRPPVGNAAAVQAAQAAAAAAQGDEEGPTPEEIEAANEAAVAAAARLTSPDELFEAKIDKMPLEQFLKIYASLTRRTVLFGQGLNLQTQITYRPVRPLTVKDTVEAFDTVLALNQITTVEQGQHFVVVVPSQQATTVGGAFSQKESGLYPEAAQYTTHIIQLKHILPEEAAELVKQFASPQGANGIVALASTKTLVLRDFAINVKRMLEVLERVDIEVEDDYKLEVIPIKYGRVEDIYATMQSVIGGGGAVGGAGAGGLGGGGGGFQQGFGGGGGLGMGNTGFGRGGGVNRGGNMMNRGGFNSGFNSFQVGEPERVDGELEPFQTAATRIATPATAPRTGATTFQQRLNNVNRGAGGQGGLGQMLEDASITADTRSNSLIVYANKKDLEKIREVVEKVDTLLAQVLIEAIIMEVSLGDTLNYGVSGGQRPKQFSGDVTGGGTINNGGELNTGAGFLGGLARTNAFPTGPGFQYFGQLGQNWDFAIQAIATDSRVNVIQRPRVVTSHATAGSFQVGEFVPFQSGSFFGGGFGNSFNIQREFVGVGLDVTPFITPDDLVVMQINQQVDQLGASLVIGNGESRTEIPKTLTRTATSTVTIRNHDAVLLGGFISTRSQRAKSGVPILKDIPGLGALFSSRNKTADRAEVMILIRPTILTTPAAAAEMAETERQRLPGVRLAEQESIYQEQRENERAEELIQNAEKRRARETRKRNR